MEVLDGQHRLEAARLDNLWFSYVVVPEGNIEDVTLLNETRINWTVSDWINSYDARGFESYHTIVEFAERNHLTLSLAAFLLSANGETKFVRKPVAAIKSGTYQPGNVEVAEQLVALWKKITAFTNRDNVPNHRQFISAVYQVLINEEVDKDLLIEKLEEQNPRITRQDGILDYLRLLEDVYNKGRIYRVHFT